jgi:hypothetical protein
MRRRRRKLQGICIVGNIRRFCSIMGVQDSILGA